MHEQIKRAVGITDASCNTCIHIDDVGDGYEYGGSSYVCDKPGRMHVSNLKGFPFQTDQECWVPNFWHSKFADRIKTGEDEEVKALMKQFRDKIEAR